MQIHLDAQDASTLRELLQQKVVELDKEINRTDSLSFKAELRNLDRTIERVIGQISEELERPPKPRA